MDTGRAEFFYTMPTKSLKIDFELKKVAGFDVVDCGEMTHYDTNDAVDEANAANAGGFNDWCLADAHNYSSLAMLAPDDMVVWSASHYEDDVKCAWDVYFGDGSISSRRRDHSNAVRLVRRSQLLEIGRAGHIASLRKAGIEV